MKRQKPKRTAGTHLRGKRNPTLAHDRKLAAHNKTGPRILKGLTVLNGPETDEKPPRILAAIADRKRLWLEANAPPMAGDFLSRIAEGFDNSEAGLHRLVWEHVSDSSSMKTPSGDWRSHAPTALAEVVRGPLWHLINLATDGDQLAVVAVLELAKETVGFLEKQAKEHPERYRELAEREFAWPMLTARKTEHNDSVRELLQNLNVGAKASDPRQRLGRDRKSRGLTVVAVDLLVRVDDLRRSPFIYCFSQKDETAARLPKSPFSKTSAREWAAAAWHLLCRDNASHPENNAKLAPYGRHREQHYEQPTPTGRTTERTRLGNIRDGIRDSLSKTIERLAKDEKTRKVPGY